MLRFPGDSPREFCGTRSSAVVIRPDRSQRTSSKRVSEINQLRISNRVRNAEVEGSIPFCSTNPPWHQ